MVTINIEKINNEVFINISDFFDFLLNYSKMDEALIEFTKEIYKINEDNSKKESESKTDFDFELDGQMFVKFECLEDENSEESLLIKKLKEKYNVPIDELFQIALAIDKINSNNELFTKIVDKIETLFKN